MELPPWLADPRPVVALRALAAAYAAVAAAVVAASLAPGAPQLLLSWLEVYWPYAGLGLGGGVLLVLCALGGGLDAAAAALWAGVPIYVLHQVEEWAVDLRGRPFAFYDFFTSHLGCDSAAGGGGSDGPCPTRLLLGLGVNIGAVWLPAALGALLGPAAAIPFLGTTAVNVAVHVAACIKEGGAYNPGLATALLLNLPWAVITVRALKAASAAPAPSAGVAPALRPSQVLPAALASGVALHAVLLGTLKAVQRGLAGTGAGILAFWAHGALAPLAWRALAAAQEARRPRRGGGGKAD